MAKGSDYQQILANLKSRVYSPIYFLYGEEPYYIDKISEFMIANVLTEQEKSFNQTILYGKDSNAAQVINSARRFPMMSSHQLVVIKEAQELADFENLVHYVENPLNSTLLVICYKYKSPDKRKKAVKALIENAVCFESEKIYDSKLPEWINALVKSKNYAIEAKAAVLLSEYLGNDLSRIENELEKLFISIPAGTIGITSDLVEKNIGISKEYNVFELQSALIKKDVIKANRIINYFGDNQKNYHLTMVVAQLYSFFLKILLFHTLKDKSRSAAASALKVNPYFIGDYEQGAKVYSASRLVNIISWLREYDLKSKGVGNSSTENGDLLRELIFKILH